MLDGHHPELASSGDYIAISYRLRDANDTAILSRNGVSTSVTTRLYTLFVDYVTRRKHVSYGPI
jgi:hypothetical protein